MKPEGDRTRVEVWAARGVCLWLCAWVPWRTRSLSCFPELSPHVSIVAVSALCRLKRARAKNMCKASSPRLQCRTCGYHQGTMLLLPSIRALELYATSFRVGSHTTRPPARVWLCFGWLSLCFVCVFVVRVSSTLLFVLCVCSSCVCVHCAVEGKKIGDRCYPRSSAGARRSS